MPRELIGKRPSGDIVSLWHMQDYGKGSLHQLCDVCGEDNFGKVIAQIHVKNDAGDVVAGTTDWLHTECARARATALTEIDPWRVGTQKDFIKFVQLYQGENVVVNFVRSRGQTERYRWRLA
jgi:hypothetical protein